MMSKKVLVIGTGAIGGLYGIMLAQAGWEVSTTHRSDYKHVKTHGLQLDSAWGNCEFKPHRVYASTLEIEECFDLILVALKVLPSIDLISMLRPIVQENTSILLIQNGVFIEKEIVAAFPYTELIRALAFVCVSKPRPGYIHHQDYGRLVLGKYPNGPSKIASRLSVDFNRVGVACYESASIKKEIWKKLLWNAPFNPMSVIGGGANTRDMLSSPSLETLVRDVMAEVKTLAEADGVAITQDMIDKNITDTLKMSPYKTSMLLDYEEKRSLEVDAILGKVIRFAEEKSIPVPKLSALFSLLQLVLLQR